MKIFEILIAFVILPKKILNNSEAPYPAIIIVIIEYFI